MFRWKKVALAAAVGVMAATETLAQAPASKSDRPAAKKSELETPMVVVLVRESGSCEPNCAQWISAEGLIETSTPARFRAILKQNPKLTAPVVIHSAGGSVAAAMEIGRLIRNQNLNVVVGRTNVEPCQPKDRSCDQQRAKGALSPGAIAPLRSICVSACSLILAGGVQRHAGRTALVGVHQITQQTTYRLVERRFQNVPSFFAPPEKKLISEKVIETKKEVKPADDKHYADVAKYFGEMGVSTAIITLMKETPRDSMRALNVRQLREFGLITGNATATEFFSTGPQAGPTFESARPLPLFDVFRPMPSFSSKRAPATASPNETAAPPLTITTPQPESRTPQADGASRQPAVSPAPE